MQSSFRKRNKTNQTASLSKGAFIFLYFTFSRKKNNEIADSKRGLDSDIDKSCNS